MHKTTTTYLKNTYKNLVQLTMTKNPVGKSMIKKTGK